MPALLALLCAFVLHSSAIASNWSVSWRSSMTLDTTVVDTTELSGVTYLGPSPAAGKHRFAAVQDSAGQLITLDIEFSATGSLTSAATVAATSLPSALDFEGAAYTNPTRNSVFLSEEGSPGVHEYDLTSGNLLQSVAIPSVFGNRASNRGFESFARNPTGTVMWTANEEALTVDGAAATPTTTSPVRLLKLDVAGNSVTAGDQFAYEVEPIHGSSTLGSPRSGLTDLVALPDGTLIGLERSVAFTSPLYLSRIYEIDFVSATDISGPTYETGLIGQSYTPVGKELIWTGTADGSSGQNLEGLTLGPQLPNGNWLLLGVVDDGDSFSSNTVVSFELSANPTADFNQNSRTDGVDFLAWQRGFGTPIGAKLAEGDANRDGTVDSKDLSLWASMLEVSSSLVTQTIPEPSTLALAISSLATLMCLFQRSNL